MPETRAGSAMGRPLRDFVPSNYREVWALNFRRLRVKRYESQDDFREALELRGQTFSKQTVSCWERGFRLPSIESLPYIADALGVKIQRLVPTPEDSPGR